MNIYRTNIEFWVYSLSTYIDRFYFIKQVVFCKFTVIPTEAHDVQLTKIYARERYRRNFSPQLN